MLSIFDIIYYTIYIISLYLSFKARKAFIPGLAFLRFFLCFGLGTEAIVEVLEHLKADSNGPYFIYIPVEYYCLVKFYALNTDNKIFKQYLNRSLWPYFVIASLLAVYNYKFSGYPSLVYNLSCLLHTIWITLLLFNFSMSDGKNIWRHPLFIILSAFLIFFSGVFFFNTTYSYLLEQDSESAKALRNYTNVFLNYILYILLSYGFLCSMRNMK